MLYNLKNHEGAYFFHELHETDHGTYANVQLVGAGQSLDVAPEELTPYTGQPVKCGDKITELAQIAAVIYKLDPKRITRAAEIMRAENPAMIQPRAGYFEVRSSDKKKTYRVADKSCECYDRKAGNICKHRIAAWMYREMHPEPADARYYENTYCLECGVRHWIEIGRYGETCHGESFDPYATPNSHISGKGLAGKMIKVVCHA